jgi:hypothetical protein
MGCGASRPELLLGPPEAEVDLRPEDNIYIYDIKNLVVVPSSIGGSEPKQKEKHVMLSGRFTQERQKAPLKFLQRGFQQALPTSTLIIVIVRLGDIECTPPK